MGTQRKGREMNLLEKLIEVALTILLLCFVLGAGRYISYWIPRRIRVFIRYALAALGAAIVIGIVTGRLWMPLVGL